MVEILAQIPLYKLARATGWPRVLPLNLTVSVTYRCNSRCLSQGRVSFLGTSLLWWSRTRIGYGC